MTLFFIVPHNESQELNYIEDFKGNLTQAIERAKKIAISLQAILKDASITVEVRNQKFNTVKTIKGKEVIE